MYAYDEWWRKVILAPIAEVEDVLDAELAAAKSPKAFIYFIRYELTRHSPIDLQNVYIAQRTIAAEWADRRLRQLREANNQEVTEAEIQQALRGEVVHGQLQSYLQQRMEAADTMTTKEALAYLKISKPTLNKLRSEGKITSYPRGSRGVIFMKSDLLAYLESKKK